ncbi:hypothetical protein [Rhizobium sp. P007]|nr:hypothetical protein [Rhizobium sp. P007]CAD7033879.1 hypothetical protein RP007_04175 [Rhizobium sp. P007]
MPTTEYPERRYAALKAHRRRIHRHHQAEETDMRSTTIRNRTENWGASR